MGFASSDFTLKIANYETRRLSLKFNNHETLSWHTFYKAIYLALVRQRTARLVSLRKAS